MANVEVLNDFGKTIRDPPSGHEITTTPLLNLVYPGQTVNIRLFSPYAQDAFEDFFIQAIDQQGVPVGQFVESGDSSVQLLNCDLVNSGKIDSATASTKQLKNSVELKWKAPTNRRNGEVFNFYFVVQKNSGIKWKPQKSIDVVISDDANSASSNIPTTFVTLSLAGLAALHIRP